MENSIFSNSKDVWTKLVATELKIEPKHIIIKEHFFHSYITAYTSIGEYKVEFAYKEDIGIYIKSIVKIK